MYVITINDSLKNLVQIASNIFPVRVLWRNYASNPVLV